MKKTIVVFLLGFFSSIAISILVRYKHNQFLNIGTFSEERFYKDPMTFDERLYYAQKKHPYMWKFYQILNTVHYDFNIPSCNSRFEREKCSIEMLKFDSDKLRYTVTCNNSERKNLTVLEADDIMKNRDCIVKLQNPEDIK